MVCIKCKFPFWIKNWHYESVSGSTKWHYGWEELNGGKTDWHWNWHKPLFLCICIKNWFLLIFLFKAEINRITNSSQSYMLPQTSEPSVPMTFPLLIHIAQCCPLPATHPDTPYILKSLWGLLLTGQKVDYVNLCFHKMGKKPWNFPKRSTAQYSSPTEDKYYTILWITNCMMGGCTLHIHQVFIMVHVLDKNHQ